MISQDDIEAFQEMNAEAIATACEFRRRRLKNIPSDRWATDRQMYLVADGIGALLQIIAWQAETLRILADVEGE